MNGIYFQVHNLDVFMI